MESLALVPEEEAEYNLCLRVAGGDVRLADEYFREKPASEVWRLYMHQVLYSKQMKDES